MHAALFGLIVADIIGEPVDLRHPPAPGGMGLLGSITLTTGGNVCNTGVAMAKLGMTVAAAGLVGEDVLGAAVIDRLKFAGMDTSAVFSTAKAHTSATMVAVEPGGERVFFHTPGATLLLFDAAAFRRCFPALARCEWVQIGYFGLLPTLTPDLPALLRELRAAAPGTKIAMDTVNPPADRALLELDFAASGPFALKAAPRPPPSLAKLIPQRWSPLFGRHMKTGLIGIKSSTPRDATSTTGVRPSSSRPTKSRWSTPPAPATPGLADCSPACAPG